MRLHDTVEGVYQTKLKPDVYFSSFFLPLLSCTTLANDVEDGWTERTAFSS